MSDEAVEGEDQATRALSIITSALAETPTWVDHGDGREQPAGGRWIAKVGLVTVAGERRHAVMVPVDVARRWFARAGADLEAARLTWRDAGILVPYEATEGGKPVRRWTHKARIAGSSPTPVLVFHPDVVEPPTPPKFPLA